MTSLSGPVSRLRRRRELAAVSLFVCIAVGSFALLRPTSETGSPTSSLGRMFLGAKAETGWVDEFERFAARRDANVIAVPKVLPTDAPSPAAPAPDVASIPTAVSLPTPAIPDADDGLLTTGSIRPQRATPLLPPVPDAEAFKVHKGDRLTNDGHPVQGTAIDAATGPHATLIAPRSSHAVGPRLAMNASPVRTAALAMKPMDLAPSAAPDSLFQGPPMPPADPALDADAPVLGYAAQTAGVEAPFKSLFAVSSSDKTSWLKAATATTLAKKPVKKSIRTASRHRRHHNG